MTFSLRFDNHLAVAEGALNLDNAMAVLDEFPHVGDATVVDVSRVSSIDSAALSVLLHWQRAAEGSISLRGVSKNLAALLHISGLEEILPINGDQ